MSAGNFFNARGSRVKLIQCALANEPIFFTLPEPVRKFLRGLPQQNTAQEIEAGLFLRNVVASLTQTIKRYLRTLDQPIKIATVVISERKIIFIAGDLL